MLSYFHSSRGKNECFCNCDLGCHKRGPNDLGLFFKLLAKQIVKEILFLAAKKIEKSAINHNTHLPSEKEMDIGAVVINLNIFWYYRVSCVDLD